MMLIGHSVSQEISPPDARAPLRVYFSDVDISAQRRLLHEICFLFSVSIFARGNR